MYETLRKYAIFWGYHDIVIEIEDKDDINMGLIDLFKTDIEEISLMLQKNKIDSNEIKIIIDYIDEYKLTGNILNDNLYNNMTLNQLLIVQNIMVIKI